MMTLTTKALLTAALLLLTAQSAIATDVCDAFRAPRLQPQLANCESLVRRNLVPNRAALKYTINYLVQNQRGFRDPSCAVNGIRPWDRCVNCQRRNWIEQGINNNCTFILNDLETPWGQTAKRRLAPKQRSTGYFVDLCTSNPSQLVSKFYINGSKHLPGDDVPRENLSTAPSNSSVLAGAFMLNGEVSNDFLTSKPSAYAQIAARHGGVPGIRMIGLNSSNNNTEFDKPLHVSAFPSGNGCPGVAESTVPILRKAVARGPSLYMSYAGARFEQRGNSCVNDSSDRNRAAPPTTAERATASVNLPQSRSVFELPASSALIRKMQVDLIEDNGLVISNTKVLTANGESTLVKLVCHNTGANEYNCRRDDNGGSFDLVTAPTPRISIGYFSADDEASEQYFLKSENNKLLVVEGKKAVISPKDSF